MNISLRLERTILRALPIAAALLLVAAPGRAQTLRPGPEAIVLARTGEATPIPAATGAVVARSQRVCGTMALSREEAQRVHETLARWRDENLDAGAGGTIRVAFHVITARGEGAVSDAQIAEQILALNRDYASSGYRFELASVDRTEQADWFRMIPGSGNERKAKQALAIDPAHRLNVYVTGLGQSLLGWASFPWAAPEDHYQQGVVIDHAALPDGIAAVEPGEGKVASHEIAHYLGLAAEEGAEDPALTLGREQFDRVRAIVPVYRPSLFAAPRPASSTPEISPSAGADPEDGRVLSFRGSFPNPFRAETALRFTLPSSQVVSLRIYSVTGQLVRTLVDATLPAGDHSAMFRAEGLPSGAYFAVLKAGSVQMNRTLMLIR